MKIAHLQPFIPHYREEFFVKMGEQCRQTIFTFEEPELTKSHSFQLGESKTQHVQNLSFGPFLIYNPLPLLRSNDVLVLMLHFGHLTTWLLLLTKWLHRRKIILWGQGISVKRYLTEEKHPDWKLRLQIALADGVWLYMEKECKQWQQTFPCKPIVALQNSLSGVREMTEYQPQSSIDELKVKYNITQPTVLIFCARFENNQRRVDLLVETIKRLDTKRFAFVIIGAGSNKPDFSLYANVYDFGALYDTNVKRELFALSDIYFQPGWVGLSIVEAMAYGKPIFTFERSAETLQCVEYSYITDGYNGKIFSTIEQCVNTIESISIQQIKTLGNNARRFVSENLMMEQMVERAMSVVNRLKS